MSTFNTRKKCQVAIACLRWKKKKKRQEKEIDPIAENSPPPTLSLFRSKAQSMDSFSGF